MPNGGSDCCGIYWFNKQNIGEAGYGHRETPEEHYCLIRDFEMEAAFWTYCANHPYRRPEKDEIPIGPVFADQDQGKGREIIKDSPDSEEIRLHLLDLAKEIVEKPQTEYPIGGYLDEMVIWQLGEFREKRALGELERIAGFNCKASTGRPFQRTRHLLVAAAKDAIKKIEENQFQSKSCHDGKD
jgi:hypothetical protein